MLKTKLMLKIMLTITEKLAQNLRRPSYGFYGTLVRKFFVVNKILEKTAVEQLKIKPDENVLEIGFGPGHGLNYVLKSGFREGPGKLFGVDFSEAMCQYASNRFKNDVKSGKLTILNEDVAKMSLQDSIFHKVFHINSHLYWPDLNIACEEIFRVMRPDSKMISIMRLERLKKLNKAGVLKYAPNIGVEPYLEALQNVGFQNIETKSFESKFSLLNLLVISCTKL